MQIIPKSSNMLGDELLCASGRQSGSANDAYKNFLDTFNQVLENAGVQTATSGDNGSDQSSGQNAPALKASLEALNNQPQPSALNVNDIKFTTKELGDLRNDLSKAGVPEEAFTDYDKLLTYPEGATLAQVTSAFNFNQTPPVLSDTERTHLEAALNKLDASGQTTQTVVNHLENGNTHGALSAVNQALQKNPEERHTIDTDEAAALCKALKFSPEATQGVLSAFGGNKALSLNAADFSRLMAPGLQEMAAAEKARIKIKGALGKTLQSRIDVAKVRMDDEHNASAKSNIKADQSLVHIQKTILRNVHKNLSDALASEPEDSDTSRKVDNAAANAQKTKKVDTPEHGLVNNVKVEHDKSANQVADSLKADTSKMVRAGEEGQRGGRDFSDSNRNAFGGSDRQKQWDPLLSKTDVRPSAHMVAGNFSMAQATGTNATSAKDLPQISRQVANQVEQAALSSMRDGSKRLDLQLGSSELGAITVSLTSRNGEVSAVIRSERAETSELMAKQLDALRTNLEEQGVKVDKLETQTGTFSNNDDRNWQGLDRHNMGQEENTRREELERLRNLARVRNSSTSKGENVLEQAVHISEYAAGNSSRGINIVA